MADFLHTMVRITDPEKSRVFYEGDRRLSVTRLDGIPQLVLPVTSSRESDA